MLIRKSETLKVGVVGCGAIGRIFSAYLAINKTSTFGHTIPIKDM